MINKDIKRKIENTYYRIKNRCYNPKCSKYKLYGARGIKVCDHWLNDRNNFYEWALSCGIEQDLPIDRIDPNGNYEPSNCRWVDNITQARNKRRTIYLTYNDITKTLKEWCEDFDIPYCTCINRIHQIRKNNIEIDNRIFEGIFKPPFYYKGDEFIYFIKGIERKRTKRQQRACDYYYENKDRYSQLSKEKYRNKKLGEKK